MSQLCMGSSGVRGYAEGPASDMPLKTQRPPVVGGRLRGASATLLQLHPLQCVAQTQHGGVQQAPGVVAQRVVIRQFCEQLEDGVDLRRRRFNDHPALEATAALEVDRGFLHPPIRSEEHTSELQSPCNLVCRLLLE